MGLGFSLLAVSLGAALSAPAASVTASIDDGVRAESHDHRFSLRLGVLSQLRGDIAVDPREVVRGFTLRLARPMLRATLWGGRVKARLMPEFVGSPRLLDASATIRLHDALSIQLGQDRPWLSRGFRTGLTVLTLPGRGVVEREFRVDRDVGVTVLGRPASGRFEYYVGVMNGAGPGGREVDGRPLLTARMVVAPLGAVGYDQAPYLDTDDSARVALGVSAYTVETVETTEAAETMDPYVDVDPAGPEPLRASVGPRRQLGGSIDLVAHGGPVAAQVEGFWRRRLDRGLTVGDWGAYGQLSTELIDQRLDVAARAGVLNDGADGLRVPAEAGLNIYVAGHHAKVQLHYTNTIDPHRARVVEHGAAAQLQLWI